MRAVAVDQNGWLIFAQNRVDQALVGDADGRTAAVHGSFGEDVFGSLGNRAGFGDQQSLSTGECDWFVSGLVDHDVGRRGCGRTGFTCSPLSVIGGGTAAGEKDD